MKSENRRVKSTKKAACATFLFGGATQNRTGDKGVADLCLTAWLWRHIWCLRSESNQRHEDFQSSALPTELQRQISEICAFEKVWRRHPESNRGIKVLQTLALPLGDGAIPTSFRKALAQTGWSGLRGSNPPPRPWQGRALPNELNPHGFIYFFI